MVPLMQGVGARHEAYGFVNLQGDPGGCMALSESFKFNPSQIEKMNRDEELGRLVPLA